MAKPFSIQSPEDIAKEYGGNKQRIAQAMQLGVVDATAGVLAGMFIDRMRSAQMQEQAPQATVAQQVMGGAQPTPPAAPAGGLGATPQAAPQPAPPMAPMAPMPPEAAMAPQQGAPMGMADGGLVALPIPDAMFDEPTNGGFNDGYAGGGLVAFADGGGVDLDAFRRAIIQQESGGRYGIPNAQGSGAMGIGQIMPDTARALAKRLGLEYRPDLLAGTDKAAREYQDALTAEATREAWDYGGGDIGKAAAYYFAGPNQKGWGEKTRKYQSDIMRRLGKDGGESVNLPERDIEAPEGRRASFEDQYAIAQQRFGALPESGLGELETYYRGELAPEKQEKARKDDMWMALARVGANMAASNSPYFLQAAGQAIAATLPSVAAGKKERKAAERDARTGLAEVLGLKRKEQKEVLDYAKDLHSIEMRAEEGQTEREFRASEASKSRDFQASQAALDRQHQDDQFDRRLAIQTAIDKKKGLEGLVASYMDKLRAEAEAGVWKTPMGNKPSEATIRHWAYQHAMSDWQKYMKSGGGDQSGLPPLGGAGGQPAVTDVGGWND